MKIVLTLALVGVASAACPDGCSGHGLCYADPLGDEAQIYLGGVDTSYTRNAFYPGVFQFGLEIARADAPPSTSEDAGSEGEAVPPAIRALIFLLQIALSYWILFDIYVWEFHK